MSIVLRQRAMGMGHPRYHEHQVDLAPPHPCMNKIVGKKNYPDTARIFCHTLPVRDRGDHLNVN